MRTASRHLRPALIAAVGLVLVQPTPANSADEVDASVGVTITIPLGDTADAVPELSVTGNAEGGWSAPTTPVDAPSESQGGDVQRTVPEEEVAPDGVEAQAKAGTTGGAATAEADVQQRAVGDPGVTSGDVLYLPPDIVSGATGGDTADPPQQ